MELLFTWIVLFDTVLLGVSSRLGGDMRQFMKKQPNGVDSMMDVFNSGTLHRRTVQSCERRFNHTLQPTSIFSAFSM